jgi:hypothetical protein
MGDILTRKRPAGRITDEESNSIKRQIKKTEILVVILAVIASISAGQAVRADQTFNIYWENDGTFIKPNHSTDRHYTDGLKTSFTHEPNTKWLRDFGRWNNFGENDSNVNTDLGYFFGQSMFTPDHANAPEKRNHEDQVFAGWLYAGAFAQRATRDQMEHFEISLGLIGPVSLADRTQRFVHKALCIEEPKGWEDQLGNELAGDFTWFKRQQIEGPLLRRTPDFDTQLEYGFTAGSVHRNAIVGLIARVGTDLPNDFGPGRLEAPACGAGRVGQSRTHLYLFGRASCKLVQYNRFLTGLETETVVGQFQLGVVWRKKNFQINYAQTYLTREFKEQHGTDSLASLNLTWYF